MKEFTRPVDELGRVVIPVEIRKENQINANDRLCIKVTSEGILLFKQQAACAACGKEDDLVKLNDKALCRSCVRTFAAVLEAENK